MSNSKRILSETKAPKNSGNRVKIVKDFLAENYEIKINVFDTDKSYIVCKKEERNCKFPTIGYISLHMEECNIRGCDSILKKLLASPDHMTVFNPIHDYLNSLEGKWKGVSMIDRLCSHIVARDFGDKEPGYYQERFYRIFKKWLVASVACSLGIKPNDVILGIMSTEGGSGKSSLIEFITPDILNQYLTISDKQEKYFDINKAFAQSFYIHFEELEGIKKSNNETLKKILSARTINIKNTYYEDVQRMGNAVFTSNKTREKGGFLYDGMNDRRYAIVEVDKIDYESYTKDVEIDQLYAEIMVLLKSADFDFVWKKPEWDEFLEFNSRYAIETPAKKLIRECYRVPELTDIEETVIFKQPSEIYQDLARKIKSSMNNISEVTIGFALKSIGYERTAQRKDKLSSRYGYNVVQLY